MRNFCLLLLGFFMINLQAQNYEITFTGSGESNTVEDVQVVYLSRGDTLDISGTDVLKLLGAVAAIPFSLSEEYGLKAYPNPMKEEIRVLFPTSSEGVVNLEVFDITGKLLVSSRQELRSGDQIFALSGLHPGLYNLRASTPGKVYSTCVISVDKNAGLPALRHENSDDVTRKASTLKRSQEVITVNMEYTDGDWILLKGKSGDYQRIVTIAPTESQTVNFEFVSCTDYDNNHYPAVSIGTQTWMAENLRTGSFNDGTEILHIEADALWESAVIPAYSWDNNDQANDQILGKLYNWFVAGGEKTHALQDGMFPVLRNIWYSTIF